MLDLNSPEITALIDLALKEDEVQNDVTTACCDLGTKKVRATILAKQKVVACGTDLVSKIIEQAGCEKSISISRLAKDSSILAPKAPWLILEGNAANVLRLERTILNFLIRMCGIATYTRAIVDALSGTETKVLHTRKTAPGCRAIDVYASLIGGGSPHRKSLEHYLLFKENHISAIGSFQDLTDRVQAYRTREGAKAKFVEIEVRDFTEFKYALLSKPNRIMLDNFKLEDIRKAVTLFGGTVELEASGGITLENARSYAETGVDYISLGSITHSTPAADLSMLFDYSI